MINESSTFTCQFCSKEFKIKNSCKRHLKNVHKMDSDGNPIQDVKKEKYTCALCDKGYVDKRALDHHMKVVHLGILSDIAKRPKKFKCTLCTYETAYKASLLRHIARKSCQKRERTYSESLKFECEECQARFSHQKNLNHHKRKIHFIDTPYLQIKRKCPLCPYISLQRSKLEIHKHFENVHEIPIRTKQFKFRSIEDFNVWKTNLEQSSTSSYIKRFSNETSAYYQCHRCGYHKSRGHALRKMKMSGSRKINGYCPANLVLRVTNNEVIVRHVSSHVGHKNELIHTNMSRKERRALIKTLRPTVKKPHLEIVEPINLNNFGSLTIINGEFCNNDSLNSIHGLLSPESSLQSVNARITEEIEKIQGSITNVDQAQYFLQELEKIGATLDAMNLPSTHASILDLG